MFYKIFELFTIYAESLNVKTVVDNREAKAIRRELESKQTPHIT